MWQKLKKILTADLSGRKDKPELFYPGPENKRKFLRQLMIAVPIGLLVVTGRLWFDRYLKTLPACDAAEWGRWWLISGTFAPTVMAAFSLPQAIKMLNAKQWPLPDAPVFRPTEIIKGRALKHHGGWVLAFCCFAMPFPLYTFFMLQHGAGFIYDGSTQQRCRDAEAKKPPRPQAIHEQNH